ncbi:MAG: hypothetical protein M5R36_28195 [Deltaproteobacteria bacterium]|nr:hypothetical protein [Deltaproteobacteria bacterium]
MQPYSLGLDIGETSIGWAIAELDSNGDPTNLLDLGVRHFPLALQDPKSSKTHAQVKRSKRQFRKTLNRRKLRKKDLLSRLVDFGLAPAEERDRRSWLTTPREEPFQPYRLRAEALEKQMEKLDIGRAIYHLAQRRGYAEDLFDSEGAKPRTESSASDDHVDFQKKRENADAAVRVDGTIGRFGYKILSNASKNGRQRLRGTIIPTRVQLENEVRAIWKKQADFCPDVYTRDRLETIVDLITKQRSYKVTDERFEQIKKTSTSKREACAVAR